MKHMYIYTHVSTPRHLYKWNKHTYIHTYIHTYTHPDPSELQFSVWWAQTSCSSPHHDSQYARETELSVKPVYRALQMCCHILSTTGLDNHMRAVCPLYISCMQHPLRAVLPINIHEQTVQLDWTVTDSSRGVDYGSPHTESYWFSLCGTLYYSA